MAVSVTVYCEVCCAVLDPQVSILTTCGHLACLSCYKRPSECPVCVQDANVVSIAKVPSHLSSLFLNLGAQTVKEAQRIKSAAEVGPTDDDVLFDGLDSCFVPRLPVCNDAATSRLSEQFQQLHHQKIHGLMMQRIGLEVDKNHQLERRNAELEREVR